MLFFLYRTIQKQAASSNEEDNIKRIQFKSYHLGQPYGYSAQADKHAAENLFFDALGRCVQNVNPRTNAL